MSRLQSNPRQPARRFFARRGTIGIEASTIPSTLPGAESPLRAPDPNVPMERMAPVARASEGMLEDPLAELTPAERTNIAVYKQVNRRVRSIDRSSADVILAVDGERVKTGDQLLSQVEIKQPGDVVEPTILRDNRETTVPITLSAGE
jgi:S1-C subfamily serine protease